MNIHKFDRRVRGSGQKRWINIGHQLRNPEVGQKT